MNWMHRVDREWLEARKNYLSASDVKKLITVTATGRPRANMDEAYLKVWAQKQCAVSENDVYSSGNMARGHLLEPYAIEEFNKLGVMPKLYHWDDTLVYTMDNMSSSPDSLDIEQAGIRISVFGEDIDPKYMGEVKAYDAERHYLVGLADKMTLEERWQIAAAFYCMPTLLRAALIMFNPNAEHPLFYHLYTIAELADELEMVEEVNKTYGTIEAMLKNRASFSCPKSVKDSCILEETIIAELLEKQDIEAGLDP